MNTKFFVLALVFTSLAAGAAGLQEKHRSPGGAMPDSAKCLTCHGGNYRELAKLTERLSPNPHATHMGEVQCDACHGWKGKGKLMCNDCHSYPDLQKGLEK